MAREAHDFVFLALEVDRGETHDAVGDFFGGGGAGD